MGRGEEHHGDVRGVQVCPCRPPRVRPAKPDLTVRLCAKVKGSGMERARALGRWARVREGFITFLCSLTTEDSVFSLSSPIDCLMVYWGGGALPPHTTPMHKCGAPSAHCIASWHIRCNSEVRRGCPGCGLTPYDAMVMRQHRQP